MRGLMNTNPHIVGYGICGPNEPYLEDTLKEFVRLCDVTVICGNNITDAERRLLTQYGVEFVEDNREWGKLQWQIKEDFVTNVVSTFNPDLCVCLDMDEVFDSALTKEGLYELYKNPFHAYYFYIINLWDDGYNPLRSFWNIRAWKWDKELGTRWPRKNLHCGLAPEWTWARAFYSPYILKHYGLKDKSRREHKAKRYDVYDPKAKFIAKEYYDSLRSNPQVEPFDEDKLHHDVVQYVHDIKQKYSQPTMQKEELVYIKTKAGETVPVPKKKLDDYTRQGCVYVGELNELEDTLDEILADRTPLVAQPVIPKVGEQTFGEQKIAAPEPELQEVAQFKCGRCGLAFDSPRRLRGHMMGKHQRTSNE